MLKGSVAVVYESVPSRDKNFAESPSSSSHKVNVMSVRSLAENQCYACEIFCRDSVILQRIGHKYRGLSARNREENRTF